MAKPNSTTNTQMPCGTSSPDTTPAPIAPTLSLPPLAKLTTHSPERVKHALDNLRRLYFPPPPPPPPAPASSTSTILDPSTLPIPNRSIKHTIHDTSVPDSGYASAEEDGDEDEDGDVVESAITPTKSEEEDADLESGSDSDSELDVLRADPLERAYAIKWITGFVTRSDVWLAGSSSSSTTTTSSSSASSSSTSTSQEDDAEERSAILDAATALLAAFSSAGHEEDEDTALTRVFSFPFKFPLPLCDSHLPWHENGNDTGTGTGQGKIEVELNDAPLSKDDHTSVGLQSWGSSILLAERMCVDPGFFGLVPSPAPSPAPSPSISPSPGSPLRILELGAGTGMLSIVAAKILQQTQSSATASTSASCGRGRGRAHAHTREYEIVATDYHPDVLGNLEKNVGTNFSCSSFSSSSDSSPDSPSDSPGPPVSVHPLDWSTFSSSPSSLSSSSPSSSCTVSPSTPSCSTPPFNKPFDIILAADVIYHPLHATWIRRCVEGLLVRPSLNTDTGDGHGRGGVFWLIIPLRTTGRHAGMDATVEGVFPFAEALSLDHEQLLEGDVRDEEAEVNEEVKEEVKGEEEPEERELKLAILYKEEVARQGNVGRADEGGYKLYKIGWVRVGA